MYCHNISLPCMPRAVQPCISPFSLGIIHYWIHTWTVICQSAQTISKLYHHTFIRGPFHEYIQDKLAKQKNTNQLWQYLPRTATHAFRSIDVFDFSNTIYFDSIEKFACVFFYICDRSSDLFLEYLFLGVLERMRREPSRRSKNRYSKNRSELRLQTSTEGVFLHFADFWADLH